MIKVIFVCHGNYHRSPMAHGLFQKLVIDNNLQDKISFDSAGTVCTHPDINAHEKTLEILTRNKIKLEHKSRLFKQNDLTDSDYVVAMDHFNIRDIMYLKKLVKHQKENIYLLRQFDPEISESKNIDFTKTFTSNLLDVPDPEVLKLEGYDKVYEIINRSVNSFFYELRSRHKL